LFLVTSGYPSGVLIRYGTALGDVETDLITILEVLQRLE
jgi:hypothetical protein